MANEALLANGGPCDGQMVDRAMGEWMTAGAMDGGGWRYQTQPCRQGYKKAGLQKQ